MVAGLAEPYCPPRKQLNDSASRLGQMRSSAADRMVMLLNYSNGHWGTRYPSVEAMRLFRPPRLLRRQAGRQRHSPKPGPPPPSLHAILIWPTRRAYAWSCCTGRPARTPPRPRSPRELPRWLRDPRTSSWAPPRVAWRTCSPSRGSAAPPTFALGLWFRVYGIGFG